MSADVVSQGVFEIEKILQSPRIPANALIAFGPQKSRSVRPRLDLRAYWHASQASPFLIASMEQAVFSAAVYSRLGAFVALTSAE